MTKDNTNTTEAKATKPRLSAVERLRMQLAEAEAKEAQREQAARGAKQIRLDSLIERRNKLNREIEDLVLELGVTFEAE